MKEDKSKKDAYERALAAFSEAMKEFHKGKYDKAQELLKVFIEKYDTEKELLDRAKIYLQTTQERGKKESVPPKTVDDYITSSIFKINSGAHGEALKLLEKALEMKADEGRVYYLMADAHMLLGKADEAMECLKKAFQRDKVYRILAQNEIDFEPIWDDKKFKLITRLT